MEKKKSVSKIYSVHYYTFLKLSKNLYKQKLFNYYQIKMLKKIRSKKILNNIFENITRICYKN